MVADDSDFRDFVTTRSRDLLRTAHLLTGNWATAEDLVQTALINCWPRWSSVGSPEAYVRTALLRTFLSWRRRAASSERSMADVPDGESADATAAVDVRASVRSALVALAPRPRAVVVLRYYADISEADTAEYLGLSVGSVKRYAADGLAALRANPALAGLLPSEVRT
jgi:RNA polymerase sigma-70 factor (sigma-E family)